MSSHKQLKYVEELFTAMTVHLGSERMLNKLKWASKPRFCTCCQAIDVNCPKMLSVAVALGDVQFVKNLIRPGADTDYESDLGAPPLVATRTGNIQIAELLLEHGADVNKGVLIEPNQLNPGKCALPAAA
jgi:hypothetical protein